MFWLQMGWFCVVRRVRVGLSERRPFPDWASYARNSIWIHDTTHVRGCPKLAVITIMDLVTRKWICELVSAEQTTTQVQVAFTHALELEGLLEFLDTIHDAAVLRAELCSVRPEYNTVRLQPASGTSHPRTSTKAAAKASAKPAEQGCIEPAAPASRTIDYSAINANRRSSQMRSNRIPDLSR